MDNIIFNQICASLIAQPERWHPTGAGYTIANNKGLSIWIKGGLSIYEPVKQSLTIRQWFKLRRIIKNWKDLKIKELI